MANPFLVLGGIAVSVVTAGIGVLAVPGWIGAAQDSAAVNDLGNIRAAESAAILHLGEYTEDGRVLTSGELGVKIQPSSGTSLVGISADTDKAWCAATRSQSGAYFAASHATTTHARDADPAAAMAAAGCTPTTLNTVLDQGFGAFTEQYRNLAVNPGMEGEGGYASAGATPAFDGSWAASGARSLRVTSVSTTNGDAAAWMNGSSLSAMNAGLQPGKTYTIVGTIRLASPQTGTLHGQARKIQVISNSVTGWTGARYVHSAAAPNVAGETELRVTVTIPEDAVWAGIRLYNGALSGQSVWWDQVMVVEVPSITAPYEGPYFDGDKVASDSYTRFSWAGDRLTSPSTWSIRPRTP